ncbi:inactive serine protease 54 isoform X2 [Tamandua tetradactyla]|uniref:inactive serine protease 54 isoform X2 n=1 Tax=Tamandua tetradactyla TaxID=48850 RepID=UPI0040544679
MVSAAGPSRDGGDESAALAAALCFPLFCQMWHPESLHCGHFPEHGHQQGVPVGGVPAGFPLYSPGFRLHPQKNAVVIVGIANMDSKKIAHEEYPVNTIILHEDFDDISMRDNIALLKTDTAIRFNDLVQPICFLSGKGHRPPVLQNCWVSGWNPTSATGNHMTMSILRKISVKDVDRCPLLKDKKTACCSYTQQETEPICLADPGNPVMCQVQHSHVWVLRGLLTQGDERCASPFLYTKVEDYSDWVMAKTEWVGPTLYYSQSWEKISPLSGDLSHATDLRGSRNVTQKIHSGLHHVGRPRIRFRGHGLGLLHVRPATASRNGPRESQGVSEAGTSAEAASQPMYYDYYGGGGGEDRRVSGQSRLHQLREMLLVFFLLVFSCAGV